MNGDLKAKAIAVIESAIRMLVMIELLLVAPADGLSQLRGDDSSSPAFAGDQIPLPPRQTEQWQVPDTELPDAVVSAIAVLFEQGLADPRGCEYRTIQLGTGSCWCGDGGVMTTRSWLLPADIDNQQQFAVAWNGLIYPVVYVGDHADYLADIQRALDRNPPMKPPIHQPRVARGAPSERTSISHESLLPIKVCLLLRLGDNDLAERMWSAAKRSSYPPDEAPYLPLATDWTWQLFDRAVGAHMRGDDNLALVSLRQLVLLRDAVEQEAANQQPRRPEPLFDDDVALPYIPFLGQIDELLADQQRRARTRDHSLDSPELESMSIGELTERLDEVTARQSSQPGGVRVSSDPIVQALVAKGTDAVEPLTEVLEHDHRLTRSVSFGRDFFRNRRVIAVRAAAKAALFEIRRE